MDWQSFFAGFFALLLALLGYLPECAAARAVVFERLSQLIDLHVEKAAIRHTTPEVETQEFATIRETHCCQIRAQFFDLDIERHFVFEEQLANHSRGSIFLVDADDSDWLAHVFEEHERGHSANLGIDPLLLAQFGVSQEEAHLAEGACKVLLLLLFEKVFFFETVFNFNCLDRVLERFLDLCTEGSKLGILRVPQHI